MHAPALPLWRSCPDAARLVAALVCAHLIAGVDALLPEPRHVHGAWAVVRELTGGDLWPLGVLHLAVAGVLFSALFRTRLSRSLGPVLTLAGASSVFLAAAFGLGAALTRDGSFAWAGLWLLAAATARAAAYALDESCQPAGPS